MPSLNAGRLRHRLRIQSPRMVQDALSGSTSTTWVDVDTVYAAIEPLSVKDFIGAQSIRSEMTVRIIIRHRTGLLTNMRFVASDGTVYKPLGFLPDPVSGREYITCPCTVGG